ncbi:MAG TPA: hypothetical protein DCZ76_11760 [Treponema sp.]|nr:hypothetical protein [Treponema sp.]
MKEKNLVTNKGESIFSFFINREEDVAIAVTETNENYFILDSKEHWFDVIQQKKPAKIKCKCKSNLFKGKCIYHQRDNSSDFYKIDFITTCISCGLEKKQFEIFLDYSPTEQLYENPLIFCPNPNLKYKLFRINSFWTSTDASNLVKFLSDAGLKINILYLKGKEKIFSEVNLEEACDIIKSNEYLKILFSINKLDEKFMGDELLKEPWRKWEIIEFSSPTTIQYDTNRRGTLYYTEYCDEYIKDNEIVSKSDGFKSITKKLTGWFSKTYYSGRGKQCADNEEEYFRLFVSSFERLPGHGSAMHTNRPTFCFKTRN